MNVPPPGVQYYVVDTTKPPPAPSASVVNFVPGTPTLSVPCAIFPMPAGHPLQPTTMTYAPNTSAINVFNVTDFSRPPPPIVTPDFSKMFSVPPPPLSTGLIQQQKEIRGDTPQQKFHDGQQIHQKLKSDDYRYEKRRRSSELSRGIAKTRMQHSKNHNGATRKEMHVNSQSCRRKLRRQKAQAYHHEIFQQFQRNFENWNYDEDGPKPKKRKCEEDSRIPACYRLNKTPRLDDVYSHSSTSSELSSDDDCLSEGEVKSDDNSSSSESDICFGEKVPSVLSNSNEKSNATDSLVTFDFSSYYDDIIESSVSDTEEEDTLFGEKQSDISFVQSTGARLYYAKEKKNPLNAMATESLKGVQNLFENHVLEFCRRLRTVQPQQPPPLDPEPLVHKCHHHATKMFSRKKSRRCHSSHSSSSNKSEDDSDSHSCSSDASETENARFKAALEEIKRKENHPARLHKDIWFNEKAQMNDGPLCRCSWKAKQSGIAHSIYPGEKAIPLCIPGCSNADRLFHYKLEITPLTNILTKHATCIRSDDHDYLFNGFSIFSHRPLPEKLPMCNVSRWNVDYKLTMVKEEPPENYTVQDLDLFWRYFFVELMELLDVNLMPTSNFEDIDKFVKGNETSCPIFHVMPRFVRHMKDDWLSDVVPSKLLPKDRIAPLCAYGSEILSMQQVLKYLYENFEPIFDETTVNDVPNWSVDDWDKLLMKVKGQLVVNPSKRPSTIRVDQIDRTFVTDCNRSRRLYYPSLIHFGVRPSVLTYTGNPEYQRAWKHFIKFRHLLSMKSKLTPEDKMKLAQKEQHLLNLKAKTNLKRDVTVELSSEGFYRTGLYPDLVQHGLMMLVMFCHLRFHWSLEVFENDRIQYKFKNKALLELAFTHPSYLSNYGTNPDHARNVLSSCGLRQPEYGDKKSKQVFSRKRGINTLIDIMSRLGSEKVKQSQVQNNERLEYLGDAVVEFLSTIHLFFMFPDLEEGGLATYRSSIVQNKHLALLGRKIGLDDFMLYAHGPDLCHEANLRHAIANAFEAVMGAIFLDGGIQVADRIFGNVLFKSDEEQKTNYVWFHLPKHPLQQLEPDGDRHWIQQVDVLRKLELFEEQTGIIFKHIRLLAKAFTRKNVGYNNLTLGHNQRLEFLGDTVLQLVTSEHLYKHFPEHHEGHLSLLRSCLVKNKTQAVICDDLGITKYIIQPSVFAKPASPDLRMKDKADLVEAFLGALYVDRGLEACKTFCRVCLYPRLKYFIMSQKWNDPKSQLQQCCLTVRNPDGGEPDIPVYKVIAVEGPTNTRIYRVAVYFKSKRLATGCGHSVQEAEMKAAEEALIKCAHLFPHLQKQKHFIKQKFKRIRQSGSGPNRTNARGPNGNSSSRPILKATVGNSYRRSNANNRSKMSGNVHRRKHNFYPYRKRNDKIICDGAHDNKT